MTDLVIGSGPAGLAVTMALLDRGRAVTLVDAGRDLEPEAEARRAALAARAPADWDPGDVAAYTARQRQAEGEILRYGSSFATVPAGEVLDDPPGWFELRASHAKGGLSNLWGSAVLPWPADEMADWPIGPEGLAPHYRAVSRFLPVAGDGPGLPDLFDGADAPSAPPLPETDQGRRLRARLADTAPQLDALGIAAGPARQAVGEGCRSCGMCLYGCPFGLIYSSRGPVARLAAEGRIAYRTAEIGRIEEGPEGVTLHPRDGGTPITGQRVFVATGVLETARLLFASLPALAGKPLTLSESAHGFTPFLASWGARGTGTDPHHTLVQAFVEMRAPEVSPHLVHTQLYGWNDFYARELATKYGRGLRLLDPLFGAVARRLIVAQSFLHSDHCPKIRLHPKNARVRVEIEDAPGFDATMAKARRVLAKGLRTAGLHAITLAGRTGSPGSSFHVGASLPMRAAPGLGESDGLGRPVGLSRVHVVDASVMPAIPASTITFSVMANAHRIGAEA